MSEDSRDTVSLLACVHDRLMQWIKSGHDSLEWFLLHNVLQDRHCDCRMRHGNVVVVPARHNTVTMCHSMSHSHRHSHRMSPWLKRLHVIADWQCVTIVMSHPYRHSHSMSHWNVVVVPVRHNTVTMCHNSHSHSMWHSHRHVTHTCTYIHTHKKSHDIFSTREAIALNVMMV